MSDGSAKAKCSNSVSSERYKCAILSYEKGICTFIGNEHFTYHPWIWLKVKSMASTASNRKITKSLSM